MNLMWPTVTKMLPFQSHCHFTCFDASGKVLEHTQDIQLSAVEVLQLTATDGIYISVEFKVAGHEICCRPLDEFFSK